MVSARLVPLTVVDHLHVEAGCGLARRRRHELGCAAVERMYFVIGGEQLLYSRYCNFGCDNADDSARIFTVDDYAMMHQNKCRLGGAVGPRRCIFVFAIDEQSSV